MCTAAAAAAAAAGACCWSVIRTHRLTLDTDSKNLGVNYRH